MKVKNIELKNFRNYETLFLDFNEQKNLIIGENAQGKTNLLEAVYYLSILDSTRIKKDSELIKFGAEQASIKTNVLKNDTDIDLNIVIEAGKNKILKVNGLKKNKQSEFKRVLQAVSFCTNDLLLLRGEPSFRRKWLDNAICQIYPIYIEKLQKYNKIKLQKANLLSEYPPDPDMLDVFNMQLATSGANIIFIRNKFLVELNKIANLKHKQIAQNEEFKTYYENEFLEENITIKELEEKLYKKLCATKDEETRKMQCLTGPHRDDIAFFVNETDSKKYASQGQQRTIVLALKLAELEIIKEKNDDYPILLLDDVLAELDITRQNYLLNSIDKNIQTIITCTDTKAFSEEFLADMKIVEIEAGKIKG